MPDDAKPLSESEIKSICAYLSDSSISLPAGDMVSTRELGLVLESAVAFEQRLFATIRELQARAENPIYECDVCEEEFTNDEGVICQKCNTHDERKIQWRIVMERAEKAEAEIGRLLDSGSAEVENLKVENKRLGQHVKDIFTINKTLLAERRQLRERAEKAEKALHDANNRIMIAEAKTERLTEKLETIAETEGK